MFWVNHLHHIIYAAAGSTNMQRVRSLPMLGHSGIAEALLISLVILPVLFECRPLLRACSSWCTPPGTRSAQ
jgi:hypothetical protein